MKALLWIVAIFLGITYLGKLVSPLIMILLGLVALAFYIFSRRVSITTFLASQAYFVKNDQEKAYTKYMSAYNSAMMKPSEKLSFAAFCLYTDRLERCRRLLNEVVNSSRSKDDDRFNAKHYIAILEWKEGNLDEAISQMEEVFKEYPSTATYGSMGVFYLERAKRDGTYADQLDFMLEAYDYSDTDKTIADNLGELYLRMGEYEKAKEIYEKLFTTQQTSPVPHYNYALVLKELGDKDKAKEILKKALNCSYNRTLTITREDVEKELSSLK